MTRARNASSVFSTVCGIAMVGILWGCAGTGEVLPVQVQPSAGSDGGTTPSRPISVGVLPFDDARSDTTKLGVRRHLGGGETHFQVSNGKLGETVAEAVAGFLRQKGWQAQVVKTGESSVSSPVSASPASSGAAERPGNSPKGHDVTLTGKIVELSANAESGFMKTKLSVASKILVQGLNAADGSTARVTLDGTGSQTVFWFEPEDLQILINDVLADSLAKLDADMKVKDKRLQFD